MEITSHNELIAAAELHFAMWKVSGLEHHYQMALQYQTWAIEAAQ